MDGGERTAEAEVEVEVGAEVKAEEEEGGFVGAGLNAESATRSPLSLC